MNAIEQGREWIGFKHCSQETEDTVGDGTYNCEGISWGVANIHTGSSANDRHSSDTPQHSQPKHRQHNLEVQNFNMLQ